MITIALDVARWEQLCDALFHAAQELGSPGWCLCTDADSLCRACADKDDQAEEFRDLAVSVGAELTRHRGRLVLSFTAGDAHRIADGSREGAAYLVDGLHFDCVKVGARLCTSCTRDEHQAAGWRALAARVDRAAKRPRPSRAPRKPRGTRATARRR